jgi:hypothetical protein
MGLRPEYSLAYSEFNAFLFAQIGEEKSGLPLTVLSALARRGLDPWEEAARLANLPKEAAVSALTAAIAGVSEGTWNTASAQPMATHLVGWLPTREAGTGGSQESQPTEQQASKAQPWLVWLASGLALLVLALWLLGN